MSGDMPMGMQLGRDLALLLPQIAALLTAVAALVAEMLRRPRLALALTVAGLLVAAGLALPRVGRPATTVFMGTYRIDDLSVWAALILLPATALCASSPSPRSATPTARGRSTACWPSRRSAPSRWPARATPCSSSSACSSRASARSPSSPIRATTGRRRRR